MMRLGLAIAAVVRAATPGSQVDDRERPRDPAAIEQRAPTPIGPTLGWSNKRAPSNASSRPGPDQRPEAMALAGQFTRGRQTAAQDRDPPPPPGAPSRVTYTPPAYTPFIPQAPYQAPGVSPPAPSRDQQTAAASPATRVSPPLSLYGGPPPPPTQVEVAPNQQVADASAVARKTGAGSKLYSMHRAYGLEPDAIPQVDGGDRYVFIGPPDPPAPKTTDDNDDSSDKADDGRPF